MKLKWRVFFLNSKQRLLFIKNCFLKLCVFLTFFITCSKPAMSSSLFPKDNYRVPLTTSEWSVPYTGYGSVKFNLNNTVQFAPQAATSPAITHATLLLANKYLSSPIANFRISLSIVNEQQLRTPTPNAWEVFWLFFNYTVDSNGKKQTNYFTFKSTGVELGTAFDERGQQFLFTSPSPTMLLGQTYNLIIEKRTGIFTAYINNILVLSFNSSGAAVPLFESPGTIGLYTEDARVKISALSIEPL